MNNSERYRDHDGLTRRQKLGLKLGAVAAAVAVFVGLHTIENEEKQRYVQIEMNTIGKLKIFPGDLTIRAGVKIREHPVIPSNGGPNNPTIDNVAATIPEGKELEVANPLIAGKWAAFTVEGKKEIVWVNLDTTTQENSDGDPYATLTPSDAERFVEGSITRPAIDVFKHDPKAAGVTFSATGEEGRVPVAVGTYQPIE